MQQNSTDVIEVSVAEVCGGPPGFGRSNGAGDVALEPLADRVTVGELWGRVLELPNAGVRQNPGME